MMIYNRPALLDELVRNQWKSNVSNGMDSKQMENDRSEAKPIKMRIESKHIEESRSKYKQSETKEMELKKTKRIGSDWV